MGDVEINPTWRAKFNSEANFIVSTFFLSLSAGNSSLRTSHCLQNGTWTPVHLTCVPEATLAGNGAADGGYLVGSGSARFNYGSGTMMVISIIAAVITGVAVAFLIIFVRKWYVQMYV